MALTVAAPGTEQLATLRKEWQKVVREAGLVPGVASKRLDFKAKRKGVKLDLMGGDGAHGLGPIARPRDPGQDTRKRQFHRRAGRVQTRGNHEKLPSSPETHTAPSSRGASSDWRSSVVKRS